METDGGDGSETELMMKKRVKQKSMTSICAILRTGIKRRATTFIITCCPMIIRSRSYFDLI